MKNKIIKLSLLFPALAITFSGAGAMALESSDGLPDDSHTKPSVKAQEHLADTKLKACQAHEHAINNLMARMASRGTKQLSVFSQIAQKVEGFYVKKGNTLSNYDALVSDVSAKKAAAQTAVDAVKSSSVTFKCDGSDPKGQLNEFKQKVTDMKTALKAYKSSIVTLIQGVRSVNATTEESSND